MSDSRDITASVWQVQVESVKKKQLVISFYTEQTLKFFSPQFLLFLYPLSSFLYPTKFFSTPPPPPPNKILYLPYSTPIGERS